MKTKIIVRSRSKSRRSCGRSTSSPVRLKFWGVRGSVPSPGPETVHYGGNTSCIEVRVGDQIIILDAGTGLRPLGRALMREFKCQPLHLTLLLTHTHWDHIQGLPFFQPIYRPQCRLRILGFEGADRSLVNVLSGQMRSPYFPVQFGELPGNITIKEPKTRRFRVDSMQVKAQPANHSGGCVGYRLFTPNGSIAYFPDHETHSHYFRMQTGGAAHKKGSRISDRSEAQKMADFLHGTDVLILDSQFDSEEYQTHIGWGHGCVDEVVALAIEAKVKHLFLFHHDPNHSDARVSAMLKHARKLAAASGASLRIDAAREGAVVEL